MLRALSSGQSRKSIRTVPRVTRGGPRPGRRSSPPMPRPVARGGRDASRQRRAARRAEQFERALRDVLAAGDVFLRPARRSQSPDVSLGNVADIRERPEAIGANGSRQAAGEIIAKQAADEVSLRIRARPIDNTRHDGDDGQPARGGRPRHFARPHLRTLIPVRLERRARASRWQGRNESVTTMRPVFSMRAHVEQRLEAAHVDAIEVSGIPLPDAHQRRRWMTPSTPRTASRIAR